MNSPLKDSVAVKPETVRKSEICESVAGKTQLPVNVVSRVLNAVFDAIIETVADNKRVQLKGFATFAPRYSPEYDARNPQTNIPVAVDESVRPSVRFGEPFKRTVNTEFHRRLKRENS